MSESYAQYIELCAQRDGLLARLSVDLHNLGVADKQPTSITIGWDEMRALCCGGFLEWHGSVLENIEQYYTLYGIPVTFDRSAKSRFEVVTQG